MLKTPNITRGKRREGGRGRGIKGVGARDIDRGEK